MNITLWLVGCGTKWLSSPSPEGTTEPTQQTTPETTPETTLVQTGTTGDTGEGPTTSWTGIYPLVPYDCEDGVPAGPFAATPILGVTTTEDFAIDPDGWLVASDWDRNLMRFSSAGAGSVFVPDAADTRGIDVLPDGDVVITNETINQLTRVAPDGTMSSIAGAGASPAGIEVASDGTLYAGDIATGGVYEIGLDGTVTDLGPTDPAAFIQTYGVALSLDEQTLYVSQYNGNTLYRLHRDASGAWSAPESWVTLDGFGLAGMAVDACDNLYVIAAMGCQVFRVSPAGEVELIAALDPPGDYCPNLAFGRDVGGWDPYALYVSTYEVLARLPVGVPGKPR